MPVTADPVEPVDPLQRLALSYAPATARAGLWALLALDRVLGQVLRSTREPLVGQMRLAWWREALAALDGRPAPAQPELQAIARHVLGCGVAGEALGTMVEGWETLLVADPLDKVALEAMAVARGGTLFAAMAAVVGMSAPMVSEAGQGWALADVARHLGDTEAAAAAQMSADAHLAAALAHRWPARLRALSALTWTARLDIRRVPAARQVARLAWHRLTGR